MDNLFSKLITEYTAHVINGKVRWEKDKFYTDDGKEDDILPDKFTDFKNLKHIKAGKSAQTPDAKRKRNYSNTVRDFYTD